MEQLTQNSTVGTERAVESECEPFDLNAYKDEIYSVIQYGRNANQDAGASSFAWIHNGISFCNHLQN